MTHSKIQLEYYLQGLSSEDLLEMYTKMVKVDHYDPCETPVEVVNMWNAGFTTELLKEFIVSQLLKA